MSRYGQCWLHSPRFDIGGTNGSDAQRFIETLHDRAWLNGFGWHKIGKAGQLLECSIIDRSVWSPERLIFEANPTLEEPWTQEPRKAVIHEGDVLNSLIACTDLSGGEKLVVEGLKEVSKKAISEEAAKVHASFVADRAADLIKARGFAPEMAKHIAENWANHVLLPDVFLEFDRMGSIAVAQILKEPKKFDGETLADPIEGIEYGRGKARLYFNNDGTVRVHSFAHGAAEYKLIHDAETLATEIEDSNGKSAKELCMLLIDAELDAVEEEQLMGAIAKKCKTTKAAVKSMVSTEKQMRREAAAGKEELAVVARLNLEFTYFTHHA